MGFPLFKATRPPIWWGMGALSHETQRPPPPPPIKAELSHESRHCMSHSNAPNELFTNLAPYQFFPSAVITEQRMWKQQTITARRSMAEPSKTTKQAYQRPVHDLYCTRRDKIYPGIFKQRYIYGLFNDDASNSRLHRTCHFN